MKGELIFGCLVFVSCRCNTIFVLSNHIKFLLHEIIFKRNILQQLIRICNFVFFQKLLNVIEFK